MNKKKRYQNFAHKIDLDSLYDDLGWEPLENHNGEDRGYCFDTWNIHNNGDTTGKLHINRDKKIYHCWVCGGGSLISLVMEVKGLDVDDATDYLYQFAGEITESDWQERMLALFEMDKQESRIEPMPYFNERVIERWIGYHEWLENKGISEDIAYRFRVGFDPDHVKQKKGKVAYDGPAIIFPHFWDGKLIGWQERWLDDERPKWVSKYTNTHDFPRERTLFNWHGAFNRGNQRTIICESVPTTLFIESANINSIATFGDQITEGQLKLLRGFQAGVILSRDNDNAGAHWRDKITEYLKRFIPVYWLPQVGHPKDDLADVFASDYEALREFIKNETYPAP